MRMRRKPWVTEFLSVNSSLMIKKEDVKNNDCRDIFLNSHNNVYLEIGCGKGRFIAQLAIDNPHINFVALERDETAVGMAIKTAIELFGDQPISNLKFSYMNARDLMEIFKADSVDKIFLNFSDPWPKKGHAKNRLTHRNFQKIYFEILKKSGTIEQKTDSDSLYESTLSEVQSELFNLSFYTNDLYSNTEMLKTNIQTEYEIKKLEQGYTIKKVVLTRK